MKLIILGVAEDFISDAADLVITALISQQWDSDSRSSQRISVAHKETLRRNYFPSLHFAVPQCGTSSVLSNIISP
jgi:hypothetical protein